MLLIIILCIIFLILFLILLPPILKTVIGWLIIAFFLFLIGKGINGLRKLGFKLAAKIIFIIVAFLIVGLLMLALPYFLMATMMTNI